MSDSLYALAIIAHPDDEAFLLAGTCLKFTEEGKTVAVICATHGEKGADRLERNLTGQELTLIRTRELEAACNILHCQYQGFFNYPDGALDQMDFKQLVSELAQQISSQAPKIVLTFGLEGISGHRDHITVGNAVMQASKRATPKPSEVWLASIPSSLVDNFSHHMEQQKIHRLHFIQDQLKGVADEKLTKIDVAKYQDQKLQAIQAHQSQYLPNLIWPYFLESEWFEVIKTP